MELQDDNIEGSLLQVQFNYSSLPVIDVSSEVDRESFQTNFIDRYYDNEVPNEGNGYVVVDLFVLIVMTVKLRQH